MQHNFRHKKDLRFKVIDGYIESTIHRMRSMHIHQSRLNENQVLVLAHLHYLLCTHTCDDNGHEQ